MPKVKVKKGYVEAVNIGVVENKLFVLDSLAPLNQGPGLFLPANYSHISGDISGLQYSLSFDGDTMRLFPCLMPMGYLGWVEELWVYLHMSYQGDLPYIRFLIYSDDNGPRYKMWMSSAYTAPKNQWITMTPRIEVNCQVLWIGFILRMGSSDLISMPAVAASQVRSLHGFITPTGESLSSYSGVRITGVTYPNAPDEISASNIVWMSPDPIPIFLLKFKEPSP